MRLSLLAGLSTAEYIHTDDTGARHKGKNGDCTVIGNDLFTIQLIKHRVKYLEYFTLCAILPDLELNNCSASQDIVHYTNQS